MGIVNFMKSLVGARKVEVGARVACTIGGTKVCGVVKEVKDQSRRRRVRVLLDNGDERVFHPSNVRPA